MKDWSKAVYKHSFLFNFYIDLTHIRYKYNIIHLGVIPTKRSKFYIIFIYLSILFLLFDWYQEKRLNLDYIKMIIVSLVVVFAYQIMRDKFLKRL